MNEKSSVLFLRPPIYEGDPRYAPVLESLGIEYLVGFCISKGLDVNYIDANMQNLSVEDVCSRIKEDSPKLICITITTEKIREQTETIINYAANLDYIKKPIICVGGHFVSYAFQEILKDYPNIDIVSVGEGEYSIEMLVRRIVDNRDYHDIDGLAYRDRDGIVQYNENKRNVVHDINILPWPDRRYSREAIQKSGLFCIIGSRGCYGNCKFCAINSFTNKFHYKKWRGRDIKDVVSELEYGVNKLKAKYVLFCDDNFIEAGRNGEKRIELFISTVVERNIKCHFGFFCRCNDIIQYKSKLRDLADIGLSHVFLGVESASQRTLDYFNKGITPEMAIKSIEICRQFGIMVEIGFIMFEPYTTLEEILKNMSFLKKLRLNSIFRFNTKLSVYYGSDFIESLKEEQLLIQNGYTIDYFYKNKGIEVIEKLFLLAYQKFIPIASIFYELKDCVTVTWYRKSFEEISDILIIEDKINDELTDWLVNQVIFFKENEEQWSDVFYKNFLDSSMVWLDKFVEQYYYFLNLYVKTIQ